MRESPLSKMPIACSGSIAGGPSVRTLEHSIFSRCVHSTAADCNIAYQNKRELYGILFRAAAETLRTIATDPEHLGAEIGFFAVLHTWGQNLLHHPHLHSVVTGGGLS